MQTPFAAIPDYLVQLTDQLRARLRAPLFVSRHRRGSTDFTRRRTLTFPVVCLLLLQKTGKSVQRHLREFFAAWLAESGAATVTPGAWTQARAKFKHTAFRELNQDVLLPLAYAPEQAAQRRTWRGHRLLGVDGSVLRLPATAALLRGFGTKTVTNQGGATGTCYPEARMSVLYDLLNDLALDARLEPLVSTQVGKRPVFKAFLLLLLTQEGGESWGEEACFLRDSTLPGPLPTRSSRGEGSCVDTNAWNPARWAKWTWPCNTRPNSNPPIHAYPVDSQSRYRDTFPCGCEPRRPQPMVVLGVNRIGTLQSKDLLLWDRGFTGFVLMASVRHQGAHFLGRCSRASFLPAQELFKRNRAGRSFVTELFAPEEQRAELQRRGWPTRLRVRFISVRLPTGELEVLVTSLLDEATYPTGAFLELYHCRWGHETYYGRLKGRLDLEHWSGETEEAVRQDFWATVFLANVESVLSQPAQAQLRSLSATRQHFKVRGTLEPQTHRCGRKTLLTEPRKARRLRLLARQPDATLAELGAQLERPPSTIDLWLGRLGWSSKKTRHAAEQSRPDVAEQRKAALPRSLLLIRLGHRAIGLQIANLFFASGGGAKR